MDQRDNSPAQSGDDSRPGYGYASVWLDMPIASAFDYRLDAILATQVSVGSWVVVPWGRRRLIGVVAAITDEAAIAPDRVRDVIAVLGDAPLLPPAWFELGRFAAAYYHRHPGEIMLPALPKSLREIPRSVPEAPSGKAVPLAGESAASATAARKPRKTRPPIERARNRFKPYPVAANRLAAPLLTPEQGEALTALGDGGQFSVHVLNGITGSGKTEVYLSWIEGLLARDPAAQVLMLVPEIALTPQLASSVADRLGQTMALLHSGLAEGERAANWLAVAEGRARIVIGTRLSVLAPIPKLAGIVVDEEHDASFKQAEGAHYSARDLAIVLARLAGVPIVLGSATPALETWRSAISGRYGLHRLLKRANGAPQPLIRVEALHERPRTPGSLAPGSAPVPAQAAPDASAPVEGLCPASVKAMHAALGRSEQILIFINRRGYAPVLNCRHCGWLSECEHCSAYQVLHRRAGGGYQLVCHHCGAERRVPTSCPSCGDVDLQPLGRGTQRIEEILTEAFPQARIARLDRDVARRRGATDEVLRSIHDGEVDIIIGTQMLTKGHDFRRLNLVIVLDADGGLFAADFRAPERLFATLMQVAGRAGRHASADASAVRSEVIIQTRFVDHPIFTALQAHDYAGFANEQLQEREAAQLPPFSFQALLKVDAASLDGALGFLRQARKLADPVPDLISVYDPVPMPMAKIADRGRAQLLIESAQRVRLHHFLEHWRNELPASTPRLRWQLEIDPAEI